MVLWQHDKAPLSERREERRICGRPFGTQAKDLGKSDDYKTEKMPGVNVSMLDGQLAWRQHDGGHTDGPNWKYFIPWADKFVQHAPATGSASR